MGNADYDINNSPLKDFMIKRNNISIGSNTTIKLQD